MNEADDQQKKDGSQKQKVEIVIYTNGSSEYLKEVLKWTDGLGWCQYRLSSQDDPEMTGNLLQDVNAILKKVNKERS